MERLDVDADYAPERDRWVEHLRAEAAELRQQIDVEEEGGSSA
jgi:hypothetical protein